MGVAPMAIFVLLPAPLAASPQHALRLFLRELVTGKQGPTILWINPAAALVHLQNALSFPPILPVFHSVFDRGLLRKRNPRLPIIRSSSRKQPKKMSLGRGASVFLHANTLTRHNEVRSVLDGPELRQHYYHRSCVGTLLPLFPWAGWANPESFFFPRP